MIADVVVIAVAILIEKTDEKTTILRLLMVQLINQWMNEQTNNREIMTNQQQQSLTTAMAIPC